MRYWMIVTATALATTSAVAAPTVLVNFEAPGVVRSTATFSFFGVETFDSRSTGTGNTFTTDFGTGAQTTVVSATYSNLQIQNFDQYGGATQTSGDKYAVAFSGTPYSLTINSVTGAQAASGLNYFGYWLSALDAANHLAFYQPGASTPFFNFTPADVLAAVSGDPAYFGMPVNPSDPRANGSEPYVFVNFYVTGGTIGRIDFSENGGGGYESDNHTVGFFTQIGGVAVPEPTSMALLGAALIALGGVRRKRS